MSSGERVSDGGRLSAFFKRAYDECYEHLVKCVFPFYIGRSEVPELFGSGVLLQVADVPFAVTAAHVLDEALEKGWAVGIAPGEDGAPMVPFETVKVLRSHMPASGDRRDDVLDLAIWELKAVTADALASHRRFVQLAGIDPADQRHLGVYYMVVGYPGVRTRTAPDTGKQFYTPLAYGTGIYQGGRGPINGFNAELHIALDYLLWNNVNPSGTLIDLPDPGGISGGGIFRMTQPGKALEEWTPEDVKLVGIVHECNSKLAVLEGTHMRAVLQILLNARRDFGRSMELNYPGMIDPKAWHS
jgi:hypothetical protein